MKYESHQKIIDVEHTVQKLGQVTWVPDKSTYRWSPKTNCWRLELNCWVILTSRDYNKFAKKQLIRHEWKSTKITKIVHKQTNRPRTLITEQGVTNSKIETEDTAAQNKKGEKPGVDQFFEMKFTALGDIIYGALGTVNPQLEPGGIKKLDTSDTTGREQRRTSRITTEPGPRTKRLPKRIIFGQFVEWKIRLIDWKEGLSGQYSSRRARFSSFGGLLAELRGAAARERGRRDEFAAEQDGRTTRLRLALRDLRRGE